MRVYFKTDKVDERVDEREYNKAACWMAIVGIVLMIAAYIVSAGI